MIYIDTSAAWKLVAVEAHAAELRKFLQGKQLVTSQLTEVELAHAAGRTGVPAVKAQEVLEKISLVGVQDDILRFASILAVSGMKSLDAIHLASAAMVEAQSLITYDKKLAKFAEESLGMRVDMPGVK